MFRPLPLWVNYLAGLGLLLPTLSLAQCPAATCTPGRASSPVAAFAMGIYNVTLSSINNTTAGYADGYKDYSCTLGATLTVSTATAISIKNGTIAPENVRVWIDYNNDGVFDPTQELAFSSDNKMLHTGTVTPPASAVLNTRLRMRVASDYASTTPPTPCSTPLYSQDEDYAVTLVANANKPTAAFTQNVTTTCSGQVQFTDQSANGPTSWAWDFGDNTSSSLQNPSHTYTAAGTYQVKLTATNAAGSSTSAATTITYNTSVPTPAAATCAGLPAVSYCCGYGITRVRLNTIDNTSADGSAGYQDFTCPQRTTLMLGTKYTLAITTGGTNAHDTRAWLDFNNDGTFSAAEKVGEALNTISPTLTLTLPTTLNLNQPLRLRLVADAVGNDPQPCNAPALGQVEDYTVTVTPNTLPPTAAFTSNYVAGACTTGNTYTFTDQSNGSPTAWQWTVSPAAGATFVNGTTANSANPQIAFSTTGYYRVTLTATNANGSSTSAASTLLIQVPCLSYCAANGGYSTGLASSLWITNVSVSGASSSPAFSNTSGNSTGGYTFFSNQSISLQAGASQTISITANQSYLHRLLVWIDYNHDGVFANTIGTTGELVYNTSVATATSSFAVNVPATVGTTRMRVMMMSSSNAANPCFPNLGEGEVEDYPINAGVLASREALALAALSVSPNPAPDGHVLVQVSDASAAGRYTLEVANILGATLLTQTLSLSPAAPAPLDLSALPAGLYLLRLTNGQGQTALRRLVRQ